jgi:hypothetical protein
MEIIAKSLLVLAKEWSSILGILGILLLGSGMIIPWAKVLFGDTLTLGDFISLGIGAGWLALFPAILLIIFFRFILGVQVNFIALCAGSLIVSGSISYWMRGWQGIRSVYWMPVLMLLAIFTLSILTRLAFISELIMPPYFDSALHYSIIQSLITNFKTSTFPNFGSFVGGYYHLGFHVLAAALSLSLGMEIKDIILILGQIILAIIPLPLFFIIKRETNLMAPALFATVLAGWGWSLPAHAINWGKYPALASILSFEMVICGIYLVAPTAKQWRWLMVCLVGLSALISTFIHTRSSILIGFAILSSLIAYAWSKSNHLVRLFSFALLAAALTILVFITRTKPALNMAFEPYKAGGLWVTLLTLSLLPFALKEFPRAAFTALFFLLCAWGSLFISVVPFLPVYDVQTLLDRPYVEMILFLPLAFLGGLGYAGMIETLHGFEFLKITRQKWTSAALALLLFGAIGANASRYNFLPSDCCNFFGQDDAAALDWMNKSLPPSANVLIAASQAAVFENTPSIQFAGSDSGIWVTPLIHRISTPFPYYTDFEQPETLDKLCKNGITYIYIGEKGAHFNQTQLDNHPDWYENLLQLSNVQVYKLAGCP